MKKVIFTGIAVLVFAAAALYSNSVSQTETNQTAASWKLDTNSIMLAGDGGGDGGGDGDGAL